MSDTNLDAFLVDGVRVAGVEGHWSSPFADEKVFILQKIILDNGKFIYVEGEHDTPYLCDSPFVVFKTQEPESCAPSPSS